MRNRFIAAMAVGLFAANAGEIVLLDNPDANPGKSLGAFFDRVRLPAEGSPFAKFFTTRDKLLHPYYVKRNIRRTCDFSSANCCRKYGDAWYEAFAELAHVRLRSCGLNTIANSSDKKICLMDRTPYTDRFDGENFQVGFVDCCGTPYPETVAGLREVGYKLYEIRSGK